MKFRMLKRYTVKANCLGLSHFKMSKEIFEENYSFGSACIGTSEYIFD